MNSKSCTVKPELTPVQTCLSKWNDEDYSFEFQEHFTGNHGSCIVKMIFHLHQEYNYITFGLIDPGGAIRSVKDEKISEHSV